jgi:hypothetical protein
VAISRSTAGHRAPRRPLRSARAPRPNS